MDCLNADTVCVHSLCSYNNDTGVYRRSAVYARDGDREGEGQSIADDAISLSLSLSLSPFSSLVLARFSTNLFTASVDFLFNNCNINILITTFTTPLENTFSIFIVFFYRILYYNLPAKKLTHTDTKIRQAGTGFGNRQEFRYF